ncbi:YdiU family protein [Rhizobium calliandrae]|uniref:Protein nucleotidyltransferase YdiU n=1 Tax=Rhizobium calliandrae TaxID=1312182 RepID=A0ABT7K890_9HYPH|nr:YdiU family protein [Rhizobium calliandrae]MDL2404357.1 YdiU family protein [Rhizobium calliandrae]
MSSPLHDKAVFNALPILFDNSYVQLPPQFFVEQVPVPVAAPRLIKFNTTLARDLGLDADALERDGAAIFSGNKLLPGSQPIAMAYAGHQFGGFVPQLGDGRAILLGEVVDDRGRRRDIQLKGSGPTPFSRRGDGRAALGPVLREYIVSEAMHALGIPTTRALAAVTTGEPVYREEVLPGAIFTRVAASHIRVGTFQYFAARGDKDSLRILADYVVDRHYPEIKDRGNRYLALLEAVADRQAALIARWLHIGFIHGVMNTDNMTISGETIDYGPCAFVDTYHSATVFSSIDHHGRYAYANQPAIGQWNIARLGETLLSLIDPSLDTAVDLANAVIKAYGERFQTDWLVGMRAKLGLATEEGDDLDLIQALLALMQQQEADFTLTFRRLSDLAETDDSEATFAASFKDPDSAAPWLARWRERVKREPQFPIDRTRAMRQVNPAFIPRNHRIEQAIEAAVEDGDFSLFEALLTVLAKPYEDQPAFAPYADPPQPAERVVHTFCGT